MIANTSKKISMEDLKNARRENGKWIVNGEAIEAWKNKINGNYHVSTTLIYEITGTEFFLTYDMGIGFVIVDKNHKVIDSLKKMKPLIVEEAKENKIVSKADKERKIFETAKRMNKKQVLRRYVDDCNDPNEACDIDEIYIWAMPDGNTMTTRNHTW